MASKLYDFLNGFFGCSDKVFKGYDPRRVYRYNYLIYIFSGFWKVESSKRWKNVMYKFYGCTAATIYTTSITLFMIDAVVVRNDLEELSFNMSSSVLLVTKALQILLLFFVKNDVDKLYNNLENNLYVQTIEESEDYKRILKNSAEFILNITLAFYTFLVLGLPLRVISDTAFEVKQLLVPMPFKESIAIYYPYIYTEQVIVSAHFMITILAFDLLGFTFILQFIAHFEILEKNFLKIKTLYPRRNFEKYVKGYTDGEGPLHEVFISKTINSEKTGKSKKYKRRSFSTPEQAENQKFREEKTFILLKENVIHHEKLLTSIKIFADAYSRPFLVQFSGMVLLIGIAALRVLFLSKELDPLVLQQALYALSTLMNIVYLCSFGSLLTNKSIAVANALYDTPWYEMSISNRNMVKLIMRRLMEAPNLKAGGMINIDRVTCVQFMQSSYNMVALLRNKM